MPTSRTLNPLHFEDLEPHRFEDLVRQLAYDFRPWVTIEATGRGGSDQGIDIRAIERLATGPDSPETDSDEPEIGQEREERVWTIQCKREKSIPPAKALKIVDESVPRTGVAPWGYLLAAATNLSAKARVVLRETLRARGVQEVIIWGKAELEDILFQPKNDHLLFAYFGISLQTRRRSARTLLGARLTIKRRLVKSLGDVRQDSHAHALLRDANSTEYPHPSDPVAFRKQPAWRYYRFAGHLRADHVAFIVKEYWAWVNFDQKYFDYLPQFDQGFPRHPELVYGPTHEDRSTESEEQARRFWLTRVPEGERAHFRIVGFIHYDRIVVVDDIGDRYHEPPHLLVDCSTPNALFEDAREVLESGYGYSHKLLFPEDAEKRALFPIPIPDISNDEFEAAIRAGR